MIVYKTLDEPDTRTLVLFAHYDPDGRVDPYVVYYLEALRQLGCIVFVSSSPALTPESVDTIRSLCAGVYSNVTPSFDFGAHHTAWRVMKQHGWSLNSFDFSGAPTTASTGRCSRSRRCGPSFMTLTCTGRLNPMSIFRICSHGFWCST